MNHTRTQISKLKAQHRNTYTNIHTSSIDSYGFYYDTHGNYMGSKGVGDKVFEIVELVSVPFADELLGIEPIVYSVYLGKTSELFKIGHAGTDKKLQKLHPAIRWKATLFMKQARKETGYNLIISQGYRTIAGQDALYAKGRTTKGRIVTKVKGGYSFHNYGLAFDVVELKGTKLNWNLDWDKLGKIGKRYGFTWGGDWKKFKDRPHFQMTFGVKKASQYLKKVKSGLTKGGYVKIK